MYNYFEKSMQLKENISFTRKERNGIFVFLILSILIIYGIPAIFNSGAEGNNALFSKRFNIADTLDYKGLDGDNEYSVEKDFGQGRTYTGRYFGKNTREKEKFYFNPNTISKDSLLRLGFSNFAANNLINYREKGGKIYSIDKLKSIYGMDAHLIDEIKSFIQIESNLKTETENSVWKEKEFTGQSKIPEVTLSFVELNSADTADLVALKGIGKYKATKILQYRERLGGFLDVNQLLEIPQIEDTLFYKIEAFLSVNPEPINKIDLNTADFRTLIRHPYMTKDAVNLILNYRKQHGPFTKAEHIKRIRAFKEDFVNKILPYLKAEVPVVKEESAVNY